MAPSTVVQLAFVWPELSVPVQRRIYPAPPDEIRICVICNEPFTCGSREWARAFRRRRTCGVKCGSILRARERTYLCAKPCAFCGEVFKPRESRDKYCSQSCYWQDKKGKPATYIPPRVPRIEVMCPTCQKPHLRRPKTLQWDGTFCSRACYLTMRRSFAIGATFPYSGQNTFYLSNAWSRLRRAVKKRDGHTCQACQRIFKTTSAGTIVHHIRPRHLFLDVGGELHPLADQMGNLILLCRSCHERVHRGEFPRFLDIS